MRVSFLSALFLAAAAQYADAQSILSTDEFEDCVDCLEDLDDARDCLRECADIDYINSSGDIDGSRLANCLDPSRDGSSVESLDELVDCCSFDDDCEDDLEDVQDCLDGCLDTCISDFADDYLECIRDNADDSDCDLDECIDGFLSDDLEDSLDVSVSGSKSGDLFSIRAIERRIERIEEDDLEDCNLLGDFVDSICDLGTDCCDECEEELGLFVDCIINDIVIPFVAIETNETIASCPIDTEECELDSRSRSSPSRRDRGLEARPLSMEEEKLFARALALPSKGKKDKKEKQSKRNPRREQMIDEILGGRRLEKEDFNTTAAIDACMKKMRVDVLASNITHATNIYMECVAVAAVQTLEANTAESGAFSVSTFAALVVAMAGSLIAFF